MMDSRMRADLDRHITGNWGEDSVQEDTTCPHSFITNVDGKYKPGDGICAECDAEIIDGKPGRD